MALGIKQKKVETKNKYNIQSLYEAIKDHEFTPGKPNLVKQGFATIIAFPEVDRQNQVQITQGWLTGQEGNKWTILKAEAAGLDNMAKNAVIGALTNGLGNLGSLGGKNSKLCEQQVDAVVAEFNALGL
ncbi:MAG: hypothetical protein K6G81_06485 [Lachnospiraceae bacterium]|nr:hypothetical protein [Lachnospiraceae bacterium]